MNKADFIWKDILSNGMLVVKQMKSKIKLILFQDEALSKF